MMTAFLGKILSAVMTDKMLSALIVEVLRVLAEKTGNTVDDAIVNTVAKNLNM